MTTRKVIVVIAVTACLVTGVSWAQNRKERVPIKIPGGEGKYAVVSGDPAIMVESSTGTTWSLALSFDRRHYVWLPVDRINTYDDADEWLRQRDEQLKENRESREKSRERN